MKTSLLRFMLVCLSLGIVATPSAFAQRQLGKKRGPTSKMYIAQAKGETVIRSGDRVYTAQQASAFDAPGTVIETKDNAQTALVYSNGVSMTIAANSRVEVKRFEQEPFEAGKELVSDSHAEPSTSQSEIHLAHGGVGITTSEFATGSTMVCTTPLGSINIRGGNISIKTTDDETIIDLLDGSATVFGGDSDPAGTTMQPGERIILRRPGMNKPPIFFAMSIPPDDLAAAKDLVAIASHARATVTFEVIEKKAAVGLDVPVTASTSTGNASGSAASTTGSSQSASTGAGSSPASDAAGAAADDTVQEIVAKPTVPVQLPTNVVVSPYQLPNQRP
ncbi:MAG TPA: FecR domain-containing protein [Lacunisphaera sp.]|nr:FecR domain-containing protein [Lacunisphaera sp.]